MARRAVLRASDADRELIAERLRNATAEGRLVASELEERLGTLFAARTYGELDALVSDLPAPAAKRRGIPLITALGVTALVGLVAFAVIALAVMIVTGAILTWAVWALLAWLLFGRGYQRGRRFRGRAYRGDRYAGGDQYYRARRLSSAQAATSGWCSSRSSQRTAPRSR